MEHIFPVKFSSLFLAQTKKFLAQTTKFPLFVPSNLKRERAISFFKIYFFVLPICIYLQLNKNNKSAILFPTLSPENYFVLVCGLPCVCPAVSALSMSWVVFNVTVSGLSVKCDYYSFKIFLSWRNGKGVLDVS